MITTMDKKIRDRRHIVEVKQIELKYKTDELRAIKLKEKAINSKLLAASKLPKP